MIRGRRDGRAHGDHSCRCRKANDEIPCQAASRNDKPIPNPWVGLAPVLHVVKQVTVDPATAL